MSAVGRRARIGNDPGTALLRALAADAPPGSAMELIEMTSTVWASATFTGARHAIRLRAADDARLAAWLAGLPEARSPCAATSSRTSPWPRSRDMAGRPRSSWRR